MKFIFDHCIAKAMSKGLAEFTRDREIEIHHLGELFPANTPDLVWIPRLRDEGYILVSGDIRITKNPVEREAWREAGFTAFFLDDGWSTRGFWPKVLELVRWWPTVMDTAKTCAPGSGFRLKFKGSKPDPIYLPR